MTSAPTRAATAVPLSDRTLAELPPEVSTPTYDRTALRPGIVHIGVGAFHRAHQAFYVDKLLSQGEAQDYAICGVGLLPGDTQMRDALVPQQGLYTLVGR